MDDFIIAGTAYRSRLLVGTGRYQTPALMKEAVEESGADIITVAVRRVDLSQKGEASLISLLPPSRYTYLPNSAGCYTADDAVRTLRLARELGGWELVKLEVIADSASLLPDPVQTVVAAKQLVKDGFKVMVYTNDDPLVAKQLEEAGCVAIMPLAAPIGTGLGILRPHNIARIIAQSSVPVLVDAGIGTASDACIAMELGCAGVLLNTAISDAKEPVRMARAMKQAVEAGRQAFLAGRMPKREAQPSSPVAGNIAGNSA